jgi:hypothetical protein
MPRAAAPDGLLTINGGSPSLGRVAITASAGVHVAFPDLLVEMNGSTSMVSVVYRWTLTGTNFDPGGTGGACIKGRAGPWPRRPRGPLGVHTTWPTTIASCGAPGA